MERALASVLHLVLGFSGSSGFTLSLPSSGGGLGFHLRRLVDVYPSGSPSNLKVFLSGSGNLTNIYKIENDPLCLI